MAGRRRVLSAANGPRQALVLFIGEAPGRFGGERSGIPFTSDRTGQNFTALLAAAGISRDEIFVTNTILCNPRDQTGRNRPPSRSELAACEPFLRRQCVLIEAPIVVPLGRVALAALDRLATHGLQLRQAVGQVHQWEGRLLVPLYHPGPRAQVHRPFAVQLADFMALGALVRQARRDA